MARHKASFPNDEEKLYSFLKMLDVIILTDYLVWIPYDHFEQIEKMGEGGFSTVYKANIRKYSQQNSKVVALKIMKEYKLALNQLRNEVSIGITCYLTCFLLIIMHYIYLQCLPPLSYLSIPIFDFTVVPVGWQHRH